MPQSDPLRDAGARQRRGLQVVGGLLVWGALVAGDLVAVARGGDLHGAGAWLATTALLAGLAVPPAALLLLLLPAVEAAGAGLWRATGRDGGEAEAGGSLPAGVSVGAWRLRGMSVVAGAWVATAAGFVCLRSMHWLLDNVKDHRLGAAFWTLVAPLGLALGAACVPPLARGLDLVVPRTRRPRWLLLAAAALPPAAAVTSLLLSSWVGVARIPWIPAAAAVTGLVVASAGRLALLRVASLRPRLVSAGGPRAAAAVGAVAFAALLASVVVGRGAGEAVRVTNDRTWIARSVAGVVRAATDVDGDGYSSLYGGGDCAPFDSRRSPGAQDIPDNGVDENCLGGDRKSKARTVPTWHAVPGLVRPKEWSFLFLVMDAVRADHVSALGYGRPTTPRLDELAARSLLFERAYSPASTTRFSVPALLMGRYPSSIAWRKKGRSLYLKRGANRSLPARFAQAQMYTGAVLCAYDIFNRGFGLSEGFGDYDNKSVRYPNNRTIIGRTADQTTDAALRMVERAGESPFFIYAHYMDPHAPYDDPGGPTFGSEDIDRYDAEIASTDKEIGRLLDEVALLRDPERIVVVVAADHGDQFEERGRTGHGRFVYDEEVHVPLVLHIPGQPPARIVEAVSLIDVAPTLANLAGVRSDWDAFEGRNLLGFLPGRTPDRHDTVVETWPFAQFGQRRVALIDPPHKLIYSFAGRVWELYDLEADPGERHNRVGRGAGPTEQGMRERLEVWLEGHVLR